MNQTELDHLKRVTDVCINRGRIIKRQASQLARLTAGSEAMQEDARNNTATINILKELSEKQAAEIARLRETGRGLLSELQKASIRKDGKYDQGLAIQAVKLFEGIL